MATYIHIGSGGGLEEVQPVNTSAGAGDAGKIAQLDAAGKWDITMMPTGVGADSSTITANETLAAGDIVNVFDNTGAECRKADATTSGKEAVGFVLSAVTATNPATVYFEGTITGLSSLTIGSNYYLDTTAGGITTTAPSATNNIRQKVGVAISATELSFEPGEAILRV
jgi:hypothetical protein